MAGGVPVFVPARPDRAFAFTAEDIAPYVTERTKALVLNSPGNPSGAVLDEETLRGIARPGGGAAVLRDLRRDL